MSKDDINKDKKYEEFLIKWAKEGTKIFNIDGGVITEDDSFDIVTAMIILFLSPIRAIQIINFLKDSMKIHKSILEIVEDVNLEFKEYEKNFALYVLGKNFKYSYDKMSEMEQKNYLIDIAKVLEVPEDKITNIINYLLDLTEKLSTSETIRRIAASNFKDNEINNMILDLGLFF